MAVLADFPTTGLDQLIKAVVAITTDRIDALIIEPGYDLSLVFQADDVAHRIVDVIQILQRRVRADTGEQSEQPAVIAAVFGTGDDSVAGRFAFDLTLRVVANGADQALRLPALAGLQPGRAGLPGDVVMLRSEVSNRVGVMLQVAGWSESLPGDVGCFLEIVIPAVGIEWPVRCLEFDQKTSRLHHHCTAEAIVIKVPIAGRVVVADRSTALVVLRVIIGGFCIGPALDHARLPVVRLLGEG